MRDLHVFLIAALAMSVALPEASSEVELGHTYEDVTHILGNPIGTLALGNKTILMYPKGAVTLRENRVSDISLMSDAEFAADQERKRIEREEWALQQEKISAAQPKESDSSEFTEQVTEPCD